MKKVKILLVIALATALVLTGCSAIANQIGNNIVSGIQSELGVSYDSKTGDYAISTSEGNINIGGNMTWPADKMTGIPDPGAKVTGVISSDSGCAVTFSEYSLEKAQAYYQKIKAVAGKNGYDLVDDDGIMYTGYDKSGNTIFFSYNKESKEGLVTLTLESESSTNEE